MKKCLIPIKLMVILLFVTGCKKEIKMSGYYDLYLPNDNYPVGAYRFYNDGRCFYYKYNRSTGDRYLFDVDDVIESNTWSSNDDTLKIRGYGYKIVRTLSDTVVLKAFRGTDKVLIKSKQQE